MNVGIIGLGRMGAGVAERLIKGEHTVVVYNRTAEKMQPFADMGAKTAETMEALIAQLPAPRVVWLYLPAGDVTIEHITELENHLQPGDYILDGGNSHYRKSMELGVRLEEKGVHFYDVGTSGGVAGRSVGYCIMAGGSAEHWTTIEPLFAAVAQENGYLRTGPIGSGHYVKMIHNAIEYGMMQAYGEGMQLLEQGPFSKELDLPATTKLWQHGSIIRSYLGELLHEAMNDDATLSGLNGRIDDNGEGRWSVEEALQLGVPVPVIAASMFTRYASRDTASYSNRVVAILRNKFGGHATHK